MKNPVKKELKGVKEIAKLAGVSIATVDRVIHNRKGVSEKTKDKIKVERQFWTYNLDITKLNYLKV